MRGGFRWRTKHLKEAVISRLLLLHLIITVVRIVIPCDRKTTRPGFLTVWAYYRVRVVIGCCRIVVISWMGLVDCSLFLVVTLWWTVVGVICVGSWGFLVIIIDRRLVDAVGRVRCGRCRDVDLWFRLSSVVLGVSSADDTLNTAS